MISALKRAGVSLAVVLAFFATWALLPVAAMFPVLLMSVAVILMRHTGASWNWIAAIVATSVAGAALLSWIWVRIIELGF